MTYIVYKTTNLINQKFYIGVHKLNSSRKDYLGSGLRIKQAIKKYGNHNFKRETLYACNSQKEAFDLEASIVTKDFLNSTTCYNIALGGHGGDLGEISNSKKRGNLNGIYSIVKEKRPGFGRHGSKHPLFGRKRTDWMSNEGQKMQSEKIKAYRLNNRHPGERYLLDKVTGITYVNIKQASLKLNINYSTLCAYASGRLRQNKRFIYND